MLLVTFLTLVWSASKGIYSISKGLNTIYKTKDERNYIQDVYKRQLLQEIGKGEKYYYEARHLLDFLSFFKTIENEEYIPGVSILKEFIGGSFYE